MRSCVVSLPWQPWQSGDVLMRVSVAGLFGVGAGGALMVSLRMWSK